MLDVKASETTAKVNGNSYFGQGQILVRQASVKETVETCLELKLGTAPYLALFYIFSTIDLMGAYFTGKYDQRSDTKNASSYISRYMHYSDRDINLLQELYRHKLIHTGMPNSLAEHDGEIYTWGIHRNDQSIHLKTNAMGQAKCFNISVADLAQDLIKGMTDYAVDLADSEDLQRKFEAVSKKLWGLDLLGITEAVLEELK